MKDYGLTQSEHNLQIYLMYEIPSNVIEADNFNKYVDSVSIGGNDLLQLHLIV
jgi:pyruvate,water dikinase